MKENAQNSSHLSVYDVITARFIAALQEGTIPWRKPWACRASGAGAPKNLISKKEYQGVNLLLLAMTPYRSPYWLTFHQAKEKGGSVKKGEKGTPIIFWKIYDREVKGSAESKRSFVLRYYTVFNLEQCDGIQAPEGPTEAPRTFDPIDACEEVAAGYTKGPRVQHGGAVACYAPGSDVVSMPPREAFTAPAAYYATLFHELAHSTGHASRLDRKVFKDKIRFGDHAYSFEELIAEISSAFLCGETGISPQTIENATAYIQNWIKVLQNEPKWIVEASAQAAKAANHIRGRDAKKEAEAEAA